MIIDMIFRFFSCTKQEKRLREQRRLVPSRPFSTSLRRPLLFRLAGKEGGEKGRWLRLVRTAGTTQVVPDFQLLRTHKLTLRALYCAPPVTVHQV